MQGSSSLIQIGTPAYRRLSLAMVMAGFSTFSLLYSTQPLLPLLAETFSVSPEESSLAVSLATGPLAMGILVTGALADRIGRRELIIWSLALSALFGMLSAIAPDWHSLLALRFLSGVALSGVPAVAMSYVSEEVAPSAISPAVGVYIAGSAAGGMVGRLGVAVLTEWLGWRWGLCAVGVFSGAAAIVFWACAPRSATFKPRTHTLSSFLASYRSALFDPPLLLLYLMAMVMMGAFVTIYNYAAFRLTSEPYGLSHAAIGAIFLLYALGSASSAIFGRSAGRRGVRQTLWVPAVILGLGVLATAASELWLIILAIAVVTIGFFGAHTIASSWVNRRAFDNRGSASALYLFFYYSGSSVLGTAGGFMWTYQGWNGVMLFTGFLALVAIVIAAVLPILPPRIDPLRPATGAQLPG